MTVQMSYAGGAPQLALTGNIGAADSSFVASTGGTANGYPDGSLGDFVVLIGSGEKVLCSARSGTTFTVALGGRGYDGTSAAAWNAGATVAHVWDAASAQVASNHINDTTRDDHTQYVRVDGTRFNARGVAVNLTDHTVTSTSGAQSTIAFDSEAFDTDAFHSLATNTSRLTVPSNLAGNYRIWGIVEFGASAVGHRSAVVKVNGATIYSLSSVAAGLASDAVPTLAGAITLPLAVGDYVELVTFQDSGGALTFNANGSTRFGMDFLGH